MSVISKVQERAAYQMALFIGILFGFLQVALSWTAPSFSTHRVYSCFVLSLVGLVAGCAGWACGMFLTPIGSQANGAQKVLAGIAVFWSGVVVSHVQQIATVFVSWKTASIEPAMKIELLFGCGLFLLSLCVTFNTRFDIPSTNTSSPTNNVDPGNPSTQPFA
jgi:hypothetical protein